MSGQGQVELVWKGRVNLRDLGHGQVGMQIPSDCEDDVRILRSVADGDLEREEVDITLEMFADGTGRFELRR